MNISNYDIVIVGAGPAGCACAYQLRKEKIKIAIIEKSTFPRDKVCGDALSADVINQFYRIDEKLGKAFEGFKEKLPSHGVRIYAPDSCKLDIEFTNKNHGGTAGYISKRIDFDNFWYNQISDLPNIDIFLNDTVEDVVATENEVLIKTNHKQIKAKMVIGADGAYSVINKKLGQIKVEKEHYCAGLRQYYKGVSGFHNNHIELHFYSDVLPGYFWIFPLPNNQANVGLGMLSSEVSKKRVNLKAKLDSIIKTHPNVKGRFEHAEPLEAPQGYGLPIGSKKRPISGNRFLLLGDAASLIDPFSGEGIANAIRSGRLAAEHIISAIAHNKFDANYNKKYDKLIYKKMWPELRLSRSIQKLTKFPKLFKFVVKKANTNESIKKLLLAMLDNVDLKKELTKPSFYLKLLFK